MKLLLQQLLVLVSALVVMAAVDCDKPNAENDKHVHICCKHPDGHNDVTEMCAKKTGFKLPSKDEESVLDVTAESLMVKTCFGKCVMDEWKLMKGAALDMPAVKGHLAKTYKADPEYIKEMEFAFDHCHSKSEEQLATFLKSPLISHNAKDFCEPLPSVILACVVREFFHNCPASRWSNSKECAAAKEFSKQCDGQN